MRTFAKHNSLSLVFLALFLVALVLQAIAGHADFNEDQLRHGDAELSLGRYVVSSEFATAVLENWQSEYLQFTLFIILTVWLVQRGSPESKEPGKAGRESDEEQAVGEHAGESSPRWARARGLRLRIYENSLLIVMGAIWVASWLAQSIDRSRGVQRRAARPRAAAGLLGGLPHARRLLGEDAPELAVGVPGGRLDGDSRGLSAPARLPGVEAGGRAPPCDGQGGLSGFS